MGRSQRLDPGMSKRKRVIPDGTVYRCLPFQAGLALLEYFQCGQKRLTQVHVEVVFRSNSFKTSKH